MEEFNLCIEIIKREGEKFNVSVNATTASQITAATAENVNYDIAHNRCSYLYRCGAINLSFAKDCFSKFFSDYKSVAFLRAKWINCPNVTVCSLSKGPGLDYIALLTSYKECGMFPSLFKNIKVISKYGAWRNTVNIMHQIISEGYLKSLPIPVCIGNIEVIQGDPFVDFSPKVKDPIFNSDVVIMVKALNLQGDQCNQEKITKSVQEFLAALKPDSVLLCIDTKPSIALITKEISAFFGSYLFQPTFMNTSINLEHTDFYKDLFGCFPVVSARGSFFVWQKSSIASASNSDYLMDEVSESVMRLLKIDDNSYYYKLPDKRSESEKSVTCSSYSSMPTHSVKNSDEIFRPNENLESVTLKSKSNGILSMDNVGIQNLKHFPSSSSLQNGLPGCEYAKNEDILSKQISFNFISVNQSIQTEPENNFGSAESVKIASLTEKITKLTSVLNDNSLPGYNYVKNKDIVSKEILHNCISVNQSIQTEPENNFKSAKSGKIASLAEKIAKLTTTLNDMLETIELKEACTDDGCLEVTCKNSLCKDCISNQCAAVAPCLHKCKCACSQENSFENSCSNHLCQQGCLMHNRSASVNSDCEVSKYYSSPSQKLKFSSEIKSAVPKLVIPLSNLSGDVVAQIIALLSQSNQ